MPESLRTNAPSFLFTLRIRINPCTSANASIHPFGNIVLATCNIPFQNGSAINGVTVLNGQPPSLSAPYEGDVDNEKWWWVCCLEFCFCLL